MLFGTAFYLLAAYWLRGSYDPAHFTPQVAGRMVALQRPFMKLGESGFAVAAPDYRFGGLADAEDDPEWSSIQLFENLQPIGPPHASYRDISAKGAGRFSHQLYPIYSAPAAFIFSSSDNSDPNTNGRNYWAVAPVEPPRDRARRTVPYVPDEEIHPMPNGKLVIKLLKPFEVSGGRKLQSRISSSDSRSLRTIPTISPDRLSCFMRTPNCWDQRTVLTPISGTWGTAVTRIGKRRGWCFPPATTPIPTPTAGNTGP
jgi:hypothetical protein